MKGKRTLLLINDERTLRSVKKAVACYTGATDGDCGEDYAKCSNYAADAYCGIDYAACSGPGLLDYCQYETDSVGGSIETEDV